MIALLGLGDTGRGGYSSIVKRGGVTALAGVIDTEALAVKYRIV